MGPKSRIIHWFGWSPRPHVTSERELFFRSEKLRFSWRARSDMLLSDAVKPLRLVAFEHQPRPCSQNGFSATKTLILQQLSRIQLSLNNMEACGEALSGGPGSASSYLPVRGGSSPASEQILRSSEQILRSDPQILRSDPQISRATCWLE